MRNDAIGSRKEALLAGEVTYFTGKECINGHMALRKVSDGHCLACNIQRRKDNRDKQNKATASWRNSEKGREWKEKNREKLLAYWAARDASPSEKYLGQRRRYDAFVKMLKRRATPFWLSKEQTLAMRRFFERAAALTESTGVKHEVDHVVPLNGDSVCGLNVPWNLQILTKSENAKKSNKYAP